MRTGTLLFLAALVAACGSSSEARSQKKESAAPAEESPPWIRVMARQYYGNSASFIIESLAGRDLVKLRSRRLKKGEPLIAYVKDDEMEEILEELDDLGFDDHARRRPTDPGSLGVHSEVAIFQRNEARAWLRVRKSPAGMTRSQIRAYQREVNDFQKCFALVIGTYNLVPKVQASSAAVDFKKHTVEVPQR